jgi:hypothetical protein
MSQLPFSGVLGIPGAEDYASSNLYLDALATEGHPRVKRILSVQWPGWLGSDMLRDVTDARIVENALDNREASKWAVRPCTLLQTVCMRLRMQIPSKYVSSSASQPSYL